jgi:D-alanine transaminase
MPPCKSVHVLDDIRWSKGRLKSISLMGNVMLSLQAARSRDDDAIFVRTLAAQSASTRLLTEGLATNVILALPDASVVTPSLESVPILAGVTRELVLRAAQAAGMPIEERAVEEHELREASEVMLVGTTTMVTSVTKMDGAPVGRGEHLGVPGPCARKLHRMLFDVLRAGA